MRDWRTAGEIRCFVATILDGVKSGKLQVEDTDRDVLDRWGTWALKCADELDPTVFGMKIPPEPKDDAL